MAFGSASWAKVGSVTEFEIEFTVGPDHREEEMRLWLYARLVSWPVEFRARLSEEPQPVEIVLGPHVFAAMVKQHDGDGGRTYVAAVPAGHSRASRWPGHRVLTAWLLAMDLAPRSEVGARVRWTDQGAFDGE
tara:strand:+ start:42129 stop:42527 length:399 start_codon:yes stop_codon:yes gene_type:complete